MGLRLFPHISAVPMQTSTRTSVKKQSVYFITSPKILLVKAYNNTGKGRSHLLHLSSHVRLSLMKQSLAESAHTAILFMCFLKAKQMKENLICYFSII